MSTKNINFDDKKYQNKNNKAKTKNKNKKAFKIDDVDVNKILVYKKEPSTQRMRLNTLLDIRPLCSRLPQVTGYA